MRATEKVITTCFYQSVNQGGLVNIEITFFSDFLEILDTYCINFLTNARSFMDNNRTKILNFILLSKMSDKFNASLKQPFTGHVYAILSGRT